MKEYGLTRAISCFDVRLLIQATEALYEDSEIRKAIKEYRKIDVNNEINKRARYDKTSKSKDVIIASKDRRIARLEEGNKRLRAEVLALRGMIYGSCGTTSGTCTRR